MMTHKANRFIPLCGLPLLLAAALTLMTGSAQANPLILNNIKDNYITGFQSMTSQLAGTMMQQVQMIGRFFDAKNQLETQQTYQRLAARAHKDYHPSETLCRFGSAVRSIALTEQKAETTKLALNDITMSTYLVDVNSPSIIDTDGLWNARLGRYKKTYCDSKNNNANLAGLCSADVDPDRVNMDIDYINRVAAPLTLDVDVMERPQALTKTEEDVLAMLDHLYNGTALSGFNQHKTLASEYSNIRTAIAANNLAQNSFVTLVAQKSNAVTDEGITSGWNFMKAMLQEMGSDETLINQTLGDFPSYYAQMDVLTKKIYQNPDFYTHLYDKPANVDRISAAMEAFRLMQMRDHYHSVARKEMLLSMMLQDKLSPQVTLTSKRLDDISNFVDQN